MKKKVTIPTIAYKKGDTYYIEDNMVKIGDTFKVQSISEFPYFDAHFLIGILKNKNVEGYHKTIVDVSFMTNKINSNPYSGNAYSYSYPNVELTLVKEHENIIESVTTALNKHKMKNYDYSHNMLVKDLHHKDKELLLELDPIETLDPIAINDFILFYKSKGYSLYLELSQRMIDNFNLFKPYLGTVQFTYTGHYANKDKPLSFNNLTKEESLELLTHFYFLSGSHRVLKEISLRGDILFEEMYHLIVKQDLENYDKINNLSDFIINRQDLEFFCNHSKQLAEMHSKAYFDEDSRNLNKILEFDLRNLISQDFRDHSELETYLNIQSYMTLPEQELVDILDLFTIKERLYIARNDISKPTVVEKVFKDLKNSTYHDTDIAFFTNSMSLSKVSTEFLETYQNEFNLYHNYVLNYDNFTPELIKRMNMTLLVLYYKSLGVDNYNDNIDYKGLEKAVKVIGKEFFLTNQLVTDIPTKKVIIESLDLTEQELSQLTQVSLSESYETKPLFYPLEIRTYSEPDYYDDDY